MFKINVKIFFLFFVLTFVSATSYSQTKEENQLIKTGEKYFENGEFSKAVKIYGQLIGANSQNPDYNYKYGACLIHTAKKKTDALPYLKYAVKNQTEVSEAHFYLGRAYHISYHFAEAIGYYKKFKSSIKEKEVKKYQLDLLISECERAKEIIKNFKQVKVLKSKKLKKSQFFRGYDLGKLNRKILVKPDEFKTNEDAEVENKEPTLVVHGPDQNTLVFSAYKKNDATGEYDKDLFMVTRDQDDNTWSSFVGLGSSVNTSFDEDYPYLHPNGKILYFSSKGHGGLGGYDIYKSELSNGEWGDPENVGFSINSPFDDIFYIVDQNEDVAYFSSNRQNKIGDITVYKIIPPKSNDNFILVKGDVRIDGEKSKKSIITIVNAETGEFVGKYQSNRKTGTFVFPLAEKESYEIQFSFLDTLSSSVTITTPAKVDKEIIYQEIVLNAEGGAQNKENLAYDASAKERADIINRLASLSRNQIKDVSFSPETPVEADAGGVTVNSSGTSSSSSQDDSKASIDVMGSNSTTIPADILADAEIELGKLRDENSLLDKTIEASYRVAQEKNENATRLKEELVSMKSDQGDSPVEQEKEQQRTKLVHLNKEISDASNALSFAKELERNREVKRKEEQLSSSYVEALNSANSSGTSSELIQKLEDYQKEIEIVQQELKNGTSGNSIDQASRDQERHLNAKKSAASKVNELKSELKLMDQEKSLLEGQKEGTRRKSVKEELVLQIEELAIDKEQKQVNLIKRENELAAINLKVELASSQVELFSEIESTAKTIEDVKVMTQLEKDHLLTRVNDNTLSIESIAQEINSDSEKFAFSAENSNNKNVSVDSNSRTDLEETSSSRIDDSVNNESANESISESNNEVSTDIAGESINEVGNESAAEITSSNSEINDLDSESESGLSTIPKKNLSFSTINVDTEHSFALIASDLQFADDQQVEDLGEKVFKFPAPVDNQTASKSISENENSATAKIKKALVVQKLVEEKKGEYRTATTDQEKNSLEEEILFLEKQVQSLKSDATLKRQFANRERYKEKKEELEFEVFVEPELNNVEVQEKRREVESLWEKAASIESTKKSVTDLEEKDVLGTEQLIVETTAIKGQLELESLIKEEKARLAGNNTSVQGEIATKEAEETNEEISGDTSTDTDADVASVDELNNLDIESSVNGAGRETVVENTVIDTDNLNETALNDNVEAVSSIETSEEAVSVQGEIATKEAEETNEEISGDTSTDTDTDTDADVASVDELNNLDVESSVNEAGRETVVENTVIDTGNLNETALNDNVEAVSSIETSEEAVSVDDNIETAREISDGENEHVNSSGTNSEQEQGISGSTVSRQQEKEQALRTTYIEKAESLVNKARQSTDPYEQQKLFDEARLYELAGDEQKLIEFNYEAQEEFTAYEENTEFVEQAKKNMHKNSVAAEAFRLEEKSASLYVKAQSKLTEANAEADPLIKINKTNEAKEIIAYSRLKQKEALKKYRDSARKPEDSNYANNDFELKPEAIVRGEPQDDELVADGLGGTSDSQAENEGSSGESFEDEFIAINAKNNSAIYVEGSVNSASFDLDKANGNSSGLVGSKSEYLLAYEQLIKDAQQIEVKEEQRKAKIEELKFLAQTNKNKSESALAEVQTLSDEKEKVQKLQEANAFREQAEAREVGCKNEEYYMANNLAEARAKREEAQLILDALSDSEREEALAIDAGGITYPKYDYDDSKGTYSPSTMTVKEGFKVITTARYNSRTKIPVDIELPTGLVYKVQVGAFMNKINPAIFNGISPLSGEKSNSGIIRYTAGLFKSFKAANMAKGRIRNLGYSDAFVVAFFDGRRISMESADDRRNNANEIEKNDYVQNRDKEVKALKKLGITEAEANSKGEARPNPIDNFADSQTQTSSETTTSRRPASASNINDVKGVYYTVQIGVYSSTRTSAQLLNISPLQTYNTSNGYIRYSTGVYRDVNEANRRRDEVRAIGVSDAYVAAYKGGTRTTVAQASSVIDQDEAGDNSVDTNEGVVFKVQIAAYKRQINIASNSTLNQLSSFGIDYTTTPSGLLLYTAGSFASKAEADELRSEIVNLGIPDAFIVAFNRGEKITVREAINLTN